MADDVTIHIRQNKVAHLYLRKIPVHEIARKLNISIPTVYNDIRAIKELWKEDSVEAVAEALTQELAKIDYIERNAWNEWQKSKGESITSTIEREVEPSISIGETEGDDGKMKKTFTSELQISSIKSRKVKVVKTAEAKYMSIIQWCTEQRCKIHGFYAAKEAKVTITDDKEVQVDWEAISRREEPIPPEREALIALEESVKMAKASLKSE